MVPENAKMLENDIVVDAELPGVTTNVLEDGVIVKSEIVTALACCATLFELATIAVNRRNPKIIARALDIRV